MLFHLDELHIEISSKCTLKCPRCPRTELQHEFINQDISLEEFTLAFPATTLQKIKKIMFCGDIGDPIYAKDFLEICEYIKTNSNTNLVIITNGSYKKEDWWIRLANTLTENDQVTFSIDGWDQHSNNQYRVNCNFDSIILGIKTLRNNSKCLMNWSCIYFSFNEDYISDIDSLAESLGFDTIQKVKSTKFDNRYLINNIDPLKPKNISSTGVFEREYKSFTGRNLKTYNFSRNVHPWARCINWQKEIFISVNGMVFPCPWFNSGYEDNPFILKYKDKISIKNRSLEEIINDNIWQELFENNTLKICNIKCKNNE